MSVVVCTVEGVLTRPAEDIRQALPNVAGIEMWAALNASTRVILLSTSLDRTHVQWWLDNNGVRSYPQLLISELEVSVFERIERQLIKLQATGDVSLFITPSPAAAAQAYYLGIPTMVYLHPKYSRPEFRPDAKLERREWDSIVHALED